MVLLKAVSKSKRRCQNYKNKAVKVKKESDSSNLTADYFLTAEKWTTGNQLQRHKQDFYGSCRFNC